MQTYSLTSNPGDLFSIDPNTGVVTLKFSDLDYQKLLHIKLLLPLPIIRGTFLREILPSTFNVNEAITLVSDSNSGTNEVPENSAENALTGVTVNAIDPDGTTVTYALTDDAGGRFKIDAKTGVLSVANSADLNFEDITSHTVTVKGTDGSTATQNFTINVSNVNEPITLVSDSNSSTNDAEFG